MNANNENQELTVAGVLTAYENQKSAKTVGRNFTNNFEGYIDGERVSDLSYADVLSGEYSNVALVMTVGYNGDRVCTGRSEQRPEVYAKFSMDNSHNITDIVEIMTAEKIPVMLTEAALYDGKGVKNDKVALRNVAIKFLDGLAKATAQNPDYRRPIFSTAGELLTELVEHYEHFKDVKDVMRGAVPMRAAKRDIDAAYAIADTAYEVLQNVEGKSEKLINAELREVLKKPASLRNVPEFVCPAKNIGEEVDRLAGAMNIARMVRNGTFPMTEEERSARMTKKEIKDVSKFHRDGLSMIVDGYMDALTEKVSDITSEMPLM